ncbi:MAG: DUF3540 domain-containing protein [Myxococcota bacterium]
MNAPICPPSVGAPVIRRSDGTTAGLEHDAIVLRDPKGRLLFSFDDGGLRIEAGSGDLTLAAPQGRVVVEAEEEVAISSPRITTVADEQVHRAGRWDLDAERLVERAECAFRRVDETYQLHAGRVRQLVRGAYQLFAGRTTVQADDDVAIDGRRVLLG